MKEYGLVDARKVSEAIDVAADVRVELERNEIAEGLIVAVGRLEVTELSAGLIGPLSLTGTLSVRIGRNVLELRDHGGVGDVEAGYLGRWGEE